MFNDRARRRAISSCCACVGCVWWGTWTAAGDGATAAVASIQYIEQEEYWQEHVLHAGKPVLAMFWSPLQKESVALMAKLLSASVITWLIFW